MTVQDYENDKAKYVILRNNILNITNKLLNFKGNVTDIKNSIMNNYQINNENTPVYYRLNNMGNDVTEIRNYLFTTIIPAIDEAIRLCDSEISKLNSQASAAAATRASSSKTPKTTNKKVTTNKNTTVKTTTKSNNASLTRSNR